MRECSGLTEGCHGQDQCDHDGDPGDPQGFLPVALGLMGLQASAALQEACRQEINPLSEDHGILSHPWSLCVSEHNRNCDPVQNVLSEGVGGSEGGWVPWTLWN